MKIYIDSYKGLDQTNNKIKVTTMPAKAKTTPFLKTVVLGINIQNAEITKNNKATPKKIFNQ